MNDDVVDTPDPRAPSDIHRLTVLVRSMSNDMREMKGMIVSLDNALRGEHGKADSGLYRRVDKLEESEKKRNRIVWLAVTAAMGCAFDTLRKYLTGHT